LNEWFEFIPFLVFVIILFIFLSFLSIKNSSKSTFYQDNLERGMDLLIFIQISFFWRFFQFFFDGCKNDEISLSLIISIRSCKEKSWISFSVLNESSMTKSKKISSNFQSSSYQYIIWSLKSPPKFLRNFSDKYILYSLRNLFFILSIIYPLISFALTKSKF